MSYRAQRELADLRQCLAAPFRAPSRASSTTARKCWHYPRNPFGFHPKTSFLSRTRTWWTGGVDPGRDRRPVRLTGRRFRGGDRLSFWRQCFLPRLVETTSSSRSNIFAAPRPAPMSPADALGFEAEVDYDAEAWFPGRRPRIARAGERTMAAGLGSIRQARLTLEAGVRPWDGWGNWAPRAGPFAAEQEPCSLRREPGRGVSVARTSFRHLGAPIAAACGGTSASGSITRWTREGTPSIPTVWRKPAAASSFRPASGSEPVIHGQRKKPREPMAPGLVFFSCRSARQSQAAASFAILLDRGESLEIRVAFVQLAGPARVGMGLLRNCSDRVSRGTLLRSPTRCASVRGSVPSSPHRALQHVELDEALHLLQLAVAVQPQRLEWRRLLGTDG